MARRLPALAVGVLGASGAIGIALLRLLVRHPGVGALVPFSRRHAGRLVGQIFPAFRHHAALRFEVPEPDRLAALDTLFLALPHGESFLHVAALAGSDVRLIDLSSDHRFADPATYARVFGRPHPAPELLARFRRVLPALPAALGGDDLQPGRDWLALPGCTPTAALLALTPLVRAGLLATEDLVLDVKTSSSAAGLGGARESQSHLQRAQGVRVHQLLFTHRHGAEIAAYLADWTGVALRVQLNTFAVDMVHGLSLAAYLRLAPGTRNRDLARLYREAYGDSPTVRLLRLTEGVDRYPNPRLVAGSAFVDLGFEVDEATGHGVLLAALDNRLGGGAAQAVAGFNRLAGWPPTTGLPLEVDWP